MPTTRLLRGSGAPARVVLLAVVAGLAAAATLVGLAGPATAAPTLGLKPATTTAVVGEPFDVSWAASPEVQSLAATGDWTTPGAVELTGSQTITPRAAGDLTFTLTGQVASGDPVVETATVTVAAAPTEVTPVAPTYPDPCSITIPEVEGLDYLVDFDGESEVLDPDTYPTLLFTTDEDGTAPPITVRAQDGFVLASGAPTSFEIQVDDGCLPQEADLVRTTDTCRAVTFTNIADEPLVVLYGDTDIEEEDGEIALEAGASRTVTVKRSLVGYVALNEAAAQLVGDDPTGVTGAQFELGDVRVQLACGDHPTVAPAAGR